jgi:hypothetical protein
LPERDSTEPGGQVITFSIPGRAKSAANLREHWAVKAKRVQGERRKAMTLCPKWTHGPLLLVTLTRYGVRLLDDDNLRGALKGIRDGIASRLGVDDGSSLVRWEYEQRTCETGKERVEVTISDRVPTAMSFEWVGTQK